MGIKMEFNKFDLVLVTPAYTPNAKHQGTVILIVRELDLEVA